MKRFLLRILPTSLVSAAIWIVVIAAAVWAVTALAVVVWDMTIGPGEVSAEVYSDANATIPASPIHWGTIGRGSHQQFIFYVKNTGVEPINVAMIMEDDVSAYMTYSFTPASISLNAGEIGQFTLDIDILPTAPFDTIGGEYKVVPQ